jgi:hypothetical protein
VDEAEAEEEVAADGQPKRKRTRRGTRGGRRRRKTPANGEKAGETAEGAVATADEPPADGYVPMSEWLDDFDSRSKT